MRPVEGKEGSFGIGAVQYKEKVGAEDADNFIGAPAAAPIVKMELNVLQICGLER